MYFGSQSYSVGSVSSGTMTACDLAAGEYVTKVNVRMFKVFSSLPHFPGSLTFHTNQKTCPTAASPVAATHPVAQYTEFLQGNRLLYLYGRNGQYFDQLSFKFDWC